MGGAAVAATAVPLAVDIDLGVPGFVAVAESLSSPVAAAATLAEPLVVGTDSEAPKAAVAEGS